MPRIPPCSPPAVAGQPANSLAIQSLRRSLRETAARKGEVHGGRTLTGIALTTGTTLVPHGLGRTPAGWSVVRTRTAGQTVSEAASSPDPSKFLALVASAAGPVDLLVY